MVLLSLSYWCLYLCFLASWWWCSARFGANGEGIGSWWYSELSICCRIWDAGKIAAVMDEYSIMEYFMLYHVLELPILGNLMHFWGVWFGWLVRKALALMFLQEYLSRYSTPNNGRIHTDISTDKSGNDEHTNKSRGWLNWLSRGMLGAGGTDDSSQFSGVVSYDVKVHVFYDL